MSYTFDTHLDLVTNELQNAIVQKLGSAPTAIEGRIYYDTALHEFGYYNGTAWVYSVTVPDATTGAKGIVQLTNDLAGTATAPTVVHFTLTSDAAAGTHKITGLGDPSSAQDAMTKAYADANYTLASTYLLRDAKDSVKIVATTNHALSTAYANGQSIDAYTLVTGDRILIAGQTTASENGIYVVNSSGAPTRAADAATSTQLTIGSRVFVEGTPGTTSMDRTWWTYISGAFTAQVWSTGIWLGNNGNGNNNTIKQGTQGIILTNNTNITTEIVTSDSTLTIDSGIGVANNSTQATLNLIGRSAGGVAKTVQFNSGIAGDLSISIVSGQNLALINSPRITGLQDPSGAQDAMTKAYGDANYLGAPPFNQRDFKDSVKAASFTNATLATAYVAGATLDGYTLVLGDRILLAGQTTATERGIYTVTAGAPTRTADAASGTELSFGATTWVENGTLWGGSLMRLTNTSFTAQAWDTGINPGGGSQNAVHGNANGINVFSQNSISLFTNSVSTPAAMTLTSTGVGLKNRSTPAAAIDIDDSTVAAGGIAFGGNQFQLYKSAANTLKLNASALFDLSSVARTDHGTGGFVSFGVAAADAMVKKDSAGTLGVRFGDDSGYAGLKAAAIAGTTGTFSGSIAANAGLAVAAAQTIDMGANRVTNVGTPTSGNDATNKTYVDNLVQGLSPKTAVRAVTTGAETYTIAGGAVTQINGTTVDGVTVAIGDMILVKNAPTASGAGGGAAQTSTSFPANGIYTVTGNTTNLTVSRSTDADAWVEIVGALVPAIAGGTSNGDTVWLSTTTPGGTLNTTAIAFTIFANATVIVGDNTFITRSGNTIQPAAVPVDPTAGANGSTVATAASLTRTKRFAVKGDGTTATWPLTHNFANASVQVQGWTDSAGVASSPRQLDYVATSANTITVQFPAVLTAGTIRYVVVQG